MHKWNLLFSKSIRVTNLKVVCNALLSDCIQEPVFCTLECRKTNAECFRMCVHTHNFMPRKILVMQSISANEKMLQERAERFCKSEQVWSGQRDLGARPTKVGRMRVCKITLGLKYCNSSLSYVRVFVQLKRRGNS